MPNFVIERDMPGVGGLSDDQFRSTAQASNAVLNDLGPDVKWLHSYVTGDKIYCIYEAAGAEIIQEHAQRMGIPANRISPVTRVIDPSTAK